MPDLPTLDPRAPPPPGASVTTVFEVRVRGELDGALRAQLTGRLLQTASEMTGLLVVVIGSQEVLGEEAP
jgi:hypothetical protein